MLRLASATALAALFVTLAPRPAAACGGCFAPPPVDASPSLVTSHRMAFAVSPTRTVLWDQFAYTGDPKDFSWVLPVRPGAYVEESTDAWFEALEAFTVPRVLSPPLSCARSDESFSCGSSSSDSLAASGSAGPVNGGVTVVHQGTVGPYETVTLNSTNPNALVAWLTQHGYVVPPNIEPIIDAYVAEKFDFLALRLAPGQGISQMSPVRVVTPGGDWELPLRMVAAGVGSFVGITLFVIGEQRFSMPDLPMLTINPADLVFDFADGTSNYLELRSARLAANEGRTFLTTFARRGAFHEPSQLPSGGTANFRTQNNFQPISTLGELYFAQAAENDDTFASCFSALAQLDSTLPVVESCDPLDPNCTPPPPSALPSSSFRCEPWTDLEAAMIGMHPNQVWLTRLEMNLPATALDADCVVEPAASQAPVSNFLQATRMKNPPCEPPLFTGSPTPALFFGGLFGAWLARRSRRRGRPRS